MTALSIARRSLVDRRATDAMNRLANTTPPRGCFASKRSPVPLRVKRLSERVVADVFRKTAHDVGRSVPKPLARLTGGLSSSEGARSGRFPTLRTNEVLPGDADAVCDDRPATACVGHKPRRSIDGRLAGLTCPSHLTQKRPFNSRRIQAGRLKAWYVHIAKRA